MKIYKKLSDKSYLMTALVAALIYFVFSATWIIFSDSVVSKIFYTVREIQEAQTYKGLFFIIFSTLVVFLSVKWAVKKISYNNALLKSVVDSVPDLMWADNKYGVCLGANEPFGELWGISVEDKDKEFLTDFAVNEFFKRVKKLSFENTSFHKIDIKTPKGKNIIMEVRCSDIKNSNQYMGKVYICRDITDNQKSERRLRMLMTAVEQSPVSVVISNNEGVIQYANRECVRSSGYNLDEIVGSSCNVFSSGATKKETYQMLWDTLIEGKSWTGKIQNKKKNGDLYWEEMNAAPVKDSSGNITHFVSVRKDVTHQMNQERLIHDYAYFDQLTSLPNRLQFLDYLSQKITKAKETSISFSLLYLDFDNFKRINETLSHNSGDMLLIECAERLKMICGESDFLGRFGGDEFVLIHDSDDIGKLEELVSKIQLCLYEHFELDSRKITIKTSIGIARFPSDADDASVLLSHADMALAKAKEDGGSKSCLFDEGMNQQIFSQVLLEEQLSSSIIQKEVYVEFQPQVDVTTGQVVGFEALLRWNNHFFGHVSPAEFIPVAEATGIILALGRFVAEQAVAFLADINKFFPDNRFTIAVNLSPKQLEDEGFVEFIEDLIVRFGINPSELEFEITEGILMKDDKKVDERLKSLLKLGSKLAMDDFGTGYASLSYLQKYPFSVVKIDRSFIKEICTSEKTHELLKATFQMVRALGMNVLAEGVETKEQIDAVKALGGSAAQGFYFGKPSSSEKAKKFIENNLQSKSNHVENR